MSVTNNLVNSVESAVLHRALELLQEGIGDSARRRFPEPGCNFAENALYWMTLCPEARFTNPVATFRARAVAGDFNPVSEEEAMRLDEGFGLQPGRRPMDEEEFAEAKADVIRISEIWDQKSEADLFELWRNAWQTARLQLCMEQ